LQQLDVPIDGNGLLITARCRGKVNINGLAEDDSNSGALKMLEAGRGDVN
jgi:hypothetical protein